MRRIPVCRSGFSNLRAIVAFTLCLGGVALTLFSFAPPTEHKEAGGRARYMPVRGGEPDDLHRMEEEWFNRLTYPTGKFDPAWLRASALQDKQILRGLPSGRSADKFSREFKKPEPAAESERHRHIVGA